ncbi:tripartite tricarboxylate transporter TctB family protein [Chenggangzhangella methanolivorans]|uniref:Tripartite tricarboxylate transporter TctB family protein n=1 Tax=Chenggangzhangella methanolivorans TaxID=1437009 RepID=A0A9E6R7N5_9HYPH|nr:tripartite tricarboxylate transporter TctB family protein [Chenggangzhangella methanolivorans]QZN98946.1 tripartite tricarboxylate transporter TctB family protein [Chenggangzhangella methanolivorans]
MTSRFDLKDALFGAFLIAVACLVFWATRNLAFGTPADMGPGFMPRALAGMAMAFGLFFAVRGLTRGGEPIEAPQVRPLACLLAAIAAFALLGAKGGIVVAAAATVVIAALGSRETKALEIIPFALAIAAASALLFVKALSLPLPVGFW